MTYTNAQMEQMVSQLRKHLGRVDLIGYTAARNTRILGEELTEYLEVRNNLVVKYGQPVLDDDGNPTGNVSLPFESEGFKAFMTEIDQFASVEHEPSLFKLKFEEAIGKISGSDLLEIDWMFED